MARKPAGKPKRAPSAPASTDWSPGVAELVERRDQDAADRLRDLAEGGDRALAKESRRALYVLRQAGVEPTPRGPAPEPAAPAPTVAHRAVATNVDGAGSQMLTFLRDDPWGGSPYFIQFLVNYNAGIKDLYGRKLPRREVDALFDRMREEMHGVVVDIPVDYGRHLVATAAQQMRDARRPLPTGYADYAAMVGEPEGQYPRALVYEHLDAEAVRADLSISHDADHLLQQEGFRGWLPDLKAVQPWVQRYTESGESRLVLAEHQRSQLGDRVIDEAADALVPADMVDALRRRLEEMALVLHLAERAEPAREALYQASTLLPGVSAHLLPFARAYIRRAIVAIAELAQEQERKDRGEEPREEEAPGLIWRP